jgi:hypothetical protein
VVLEKRSTGATTDSRRFKKKMLLGLSIAWGLTLLVDFGIAAKAAQLAGGRWTQLQVLSFVFAVAG